MERFTGIARSAAMASGSSMKKSPVMMSLLAMALFALGCVAETRDESDPIESAQESEVIGHPGVDWYYTCSNDLLVCSSGYGAVEWVPNAGCGDLLRIKCQFGAQNP